MGSILYLATEKGLVTLKSSDEHSWKMENQGLQEWVIHAVDAPSSASNRVFAGTRGDGVWVSEDFGKSWKKPCYGRPGPGKVRSITFEPRDARLLYAGGEPIEVYVSDDCGKSWAQLDSLRKVPWVESVDYQVATVEPHVRDVAVDPKDPKKIYVALQVGYMLKSVDGGVTWKLLDKGLDPDVHTIVIHPENGDIIYVATGGRDCRHGRGKGRALYMSKDGGESWTPIATEFTQEYSVPLVIDPKNPSILYSSLANGQPGKWRRRPTGAESLVARTKDGGKSWQKLDGPLSETNKDFAEAIAINEMNPNRVYAALKSGELYASEDGGDSWVKLDVKSPAAVMDMKCVPT